MSSLWSADPKDAINLGKGHPNPSLFPLSEIQDAFRKASAVPGASVALLQYGRMQGPPRLCELIIQWIKDASGRNENAATADNILITTGAGPGMSLVCQLFSKPGDIVFVDSPGYFLAYYSFVDCGLTTVNIPTDRDGMNVDLIEKFLKEGKRPSLVYTVPIANNPSGVALSEDRKRRLVELSRKYNFKIVADEVYQFLTFQEDLPVSLFEYDDPANPTVFSINSFSKILGPGLRLGWIISHKPNLDRLLDCGALHSGGGFNPFTGTLVTELLESEFVGEHAAKLRAFYRKTCDALCDAIDKYMCTAVRPEEKVWYYRPTGGFFCFVHLPDRFNTEKLLEVANQCGVSYFAGCNSSPDKSLFTSSLRLCFGFLDADDIVEGVKRLGIAMKQYSETEN